MSLAANALVTMDELREFLGQTSGAEDDVIQGQINRASDYCDWWCNRPLKARAFANLRLPAQQSRVLRVPATPIDLTATLTIKVNEAAQTIWKTEADGDRSLADVIVGTDDQGSPNHFYRLNGWGWGSWDPFPILMSYSGGLKTVPGELKDACFLIVQNLRRAKEGLADLAAMGSGPVTGGVTFRQDLIPLKAKYILDSYRLVTL